MKSGTVETVSGSLSVNRKFGDVVMHRMACCDMRLLDGSSNSWQLTCCVGALVVSLDLQSRCICLSNLVSSMFSYFVSLA